MRDWWGYDGMFWQFLVVTQIEGPKQLIHSFRCLMDGSLRFPGEHVRCMHQRTRRQRKYRWQSTQHWRAEDAEFPIENVFFYLQKHFLSLVVSIAFQLVQLLYRCPHLLLYITLVLSSAKTGTTSLRKRGREREREREEKKRQRETESKNPGNKLSDWPLLWCGFSFSTVTTSSNSNFQILPKWRDGPRLGIARSISKQRTLIRPPRRHTDSESAPPQPRQP